MIDLDDYYSGGYFLIRADHPGWEQLKNGLLPDKLISLSECICPRLAVHWGWHPGDREAALRFGIPEAQLDAFVQWCGDAHQIDIAFPSMFYSLDAARRCIEQFIPNTDGLYLISAGLHKRVEATDWYEGKSPLDREPYGVMGQIEKHLPLVEGGIPLGFEIICFAYSDFADSWFCNGLHEEMHTLFGIRPGQYGLIQSQEEAHKVYEWIEDDPEKRRGEPYPYAYWLLVSYPLK